MGNGHIFNSRFCALDCASINTVANTAGGLRCGIRQIDFEIKRRFNLRLILAFLLN
jgi:hypothetical protein